MYPVAPAISRVVPAAYPTPLTRPAARSRAKGSVAAAARTTTASVAARSRRVEPPRAACAARPSAAVPPQSAARKSGWKNPNDTYVRGGESHPSQAAVAAALTAAGRPSVQTAARNVERRVSAASQTSASAKIAPQ